jgi:DNA processing protein
VDVAAAVPAVAVAELLADSRIGLAEVEFWQCLLAAETSPHKWQALVGLCKRPEAVQLLLSSRILSDSERQRATQVRLDTVRDLTSRGVGILDRARLPERYAAIPSAPPALFYWGDPACLRKPSLAIVGTRAATTYGKAVAQKFAEAIARAGVTIVSGGALGIDAAAHKGAMNVGGRTAAVLLTGIDRVYPRVHHGLFEQIKQNGCILSQFAAASTSNRDYRPLQRNQTVAALSSAILVVEAPERSGALSTASAGNEFGRQVFVVPANIDNVNFRGSHGLIRDGATLVDHPDQVLEAMQIAPVDSMTSSEPLSEVQQLIVNCLSSTPASCEVIVDKTGLSTSDVLSELTMLELEGRIIKDVAGYILRP